jgi:hypothetical protein
MHKAVVHGVCETSVLPVSICTQYCFAVFSGFDLSCIIEQHIFASKYITVELTKGNVHHLFIYLFSICNCYNQQLDKSVYLNITITINNHNP